MSSLIDRLPSARRPTGSDAAPSPVVVGVAAAVQAAAASVVLVLLPVVLAWAGTGTGASWVQAVRVGLDGWLLAHRTGIAVDTGHVGVTPLGLTALAALTCWFSARRLARRLDPNGEAIRAGLGRARPVPPPLKALAGFALGYAGTACVAALLAGTPQAHPLLLQAVLGSGVLAALTGALAAVTYAGEGWRGGFDRLADLARLPAAPRRWVPPALVALGVELALSALLVLVAVTGSFDRVLALHRGLDPGVTGGIALLALQLAVLPNLAVWAAAFSAGPGFALGLGTSVTPATTVLGPLPALPVLAALPVPGPQPGWARLVIVVPVIAGGVAGWLAVRRRPQDAVSEALLDALAAAALAALGFAALAWLSGGPAGPGRLAVTGPQPLPAAGLLGIELALGALAGGLLAGGLPRLAGRMTRVPGHKPCESGEHGGAVG